MSYRTWPPLAAPHWMQDGTLLPARAQVSTDGEFIWVYDDPANARTEIETFTMADLTAAVRDALPPTVAGGTDWASLRLDAATDANGTPPPSDPPHAPTGVCLDSSGAVHMRGHLIPAGSSLFSLPMMFSPDQATRVPVATATGVDILSIGADGRVTFAGAAGTEIALEGFSYESGLGATLALTVSPIYPLEPDPTNPPFTYIIGSASGPLPAIAGGVIGWAANVGEGTPLMEVDFGDEHHIGGDWIAHYVGQTPVPNTYEVLDGPSTGQTGTFELYGPPWDPNVWAGMFVFKSFTPELPTAGNVRFTFAMDFGYYL
jgi:hypothetical protein